MITDPIIRKATSADLPAINAIFYRNEVANEPEDSPNRPAPRLLAGLAHLLVTGEIHVALQQDVLIGFASRMVRGPVAYLTDLFVDSQYQSRGIGQRLLAAGFPNDVPIRCTMSSTDTRAHALYTRLGMRPQWPNYWLLARTDQLDSLHEGGIQMVAASLDDLEWQAWDAELSGRSRTEEMPYWLEQCRARPFWFLRSGTRVGYGLIQTISDGSLLYPDAYTLGPIGAHTELDAMACVLAAANWTRQRTITLRITVPGPHPALKPLLDAHCEITYIETFHSSASTPFFDARLYLPPGDLF